MIHVGYLHLSSQQTYLAGVVMTFLQMNKLRFREADSLLSVHRGRLEMESVRLEILALLTPQKLDTLCDMASSLFHGIQVFLMCLILRMRLLSPILFQVI